MNNYEFCVQWVLDQTPQENIRVLDYGCGAGQIVNELRAAKIDAFGCDVFYEGGDYSKSLEDGILGNAIKRMEDSKIPFDDASFDFVINNQVLEHVEDLDSVLSEISRVLKPGGKVLSMFPDKSVWREGHCGIPFLHWFPKKSYLRIYYAAAFRLLGFGYHKGDKKIMHWSKDFCEWLDKWTWYRNLSDIQRVFDQHFEYTQHIEEIWLRRRLGTRNTIIRFIPTVLQQFIVRKLGGLVFVALKSPV